MRTTKWLRLARPPGASWYVALGLVALAAAPVAHAGPGAVPSTDLLGLPKTVPVYYANSPSGVHTVLDQGTGAANTASDSGTPLRKFVDPLPGIDPVTNCGAAAWALVSPSTPTAVNGGAGGQAPNQVTAKGTTQTCIPLAVPDTATYPGSDYYVIGVVEYAQQMHSDLPKSTALRGYTQLNNATYPATQATVPDPQNPTQMVTTYTAWPQPHYLGPIIVATRDRPVRVKYVNLLPTGRATFTTAGQPSCEMITVTAGSGASTQGYTNGAVPGNMDSTFKSYSTPGSQLDAGIPEVSPATVPPTYVTGNYAFCEAIANAPVATARNGDLMVPNDITIRGAGIATDQNNTSNCASELSPAGSATVNLLDVFQNADAIGAAGLAAATAGSPIPADPTYAKKYPTSTCLNTLNRTEVHLHGGMNPWISDGTPHQWVVPTLENAKAAWPQGQGGLGRVGESFVNVPDMPDPGPGAGTLFWTNQQSARLMFYHDHTTGMTRTNVYVGEAAGYVLRDPIEATLESGGTITPPAATGLAAVSVPAGTIPTVGIPLVIEDKTFVPADVTAQDPLWSTSWWGAPGDLWYPHVYETNQDPYSITGSNNAGRWDYGQWFFPPMNPSTLRGPIPQPSLAPEGFMDTPVINGTAYPVLHVAAGLTRFRILNVPNERNSNLSWFLADSTVTGAAPAVANTEVKMLPAVPPPALPATPVAGTVYACAAAANNLDGTLFGGQPMPVLDSTGYPLNGTGLPRQGMTYTQPASTTGQNHYLVATGTDGGPCWPASWPTDGRDGGVPDPTNAGPAWIQIGTEGGFLPQPQIIPPTPLGYEYNRRSVSVLNTYYHGLYVGPAERVDVLVDFSNFAGKTLILYNDAPAPNPGFDARNDYYTGDVDQTPSGGAPTTMAGFGPNTRTIMQVVVDGVGAPVGSTATAITGAQLNSLATSILPAAFAASQPAPIVGEPGFSLAFPVNAKATAAASATNTVAGITGVTVGGSTTFTLASYLLPVPNVGETVTIAGITASPTPVNGVYTVATSTPAVGTTAGSFSVALVTTGDTVTTPIAGSATYVNPGISGGAFPQQYGAIGDHTHTFYAGNTATASKFTVYEASTGPAAQPAGDNLLGSAAIHEVFDTDYGRMNSVEGYELPATNFLTQTTVPLAYVDPTTDAFKEGETQIWKITHNGVDTHTIHFHLLNLQVLNRVGWDGTIRPPDPDENGWKESIKMNPLEDIFVAFQAVKPYLPFNLPDSKRRLDPTQPTTSVANFTNPPGGEFPYVAPMNCNQGPATTPAFAPLLPTAVAATAACTNVYGLSVAAQTNVVANFGWEYVWHCHLLGHEENDMMRPLVLSVQSLTPPAPTGPAAAVQPPVAASAASPGTVGGMSLTWVDPTPVTYNSAVGWPYLAIAQTSTGTIQGPNQLGTALAANLGNAQNEIGFHVYRISAPVTAVGTPTTATTPTSLSGMSLVGTAPANSGSGASAVGTAPGPFVDTTATTLGAWYAYAVTAFNQAGESAPVFSAYAQQTAMLAPPAAVTTLVATPNAAGGTPTVTLTWSASPGATGNAILRCSSATIGGAQPACTPVAPAIATAAAVATYLDSTVAANTQYCYMLNPSNGIGATTVGNNIACATTPATPAVAPATVTAAFTPMPTNTSATAPFAMTVNWAASASTNASGYVVQACTVGCSALGAGTWANTATQPAGTAVTVADSQAQGLLVTYRVATTTSLSSCIGATCTTSTVQSPWTYSTALQLAVIPAAATAPTATPSTTTPITVSLAWTNPAPALNAAPTAWIVNRATPPAAFAVINTSATAITSYVDSTGLLPGTTYDYTVTLQNAAGQATSAPVTAVTTAISIAAPGPLVLSTQFAPNPAYNRVGLQFTNNATNQTGFPVYRMLGACPAAAPANLTTTAPPAPWTFLNTVTGTGFGGGATVRYTDGTVGPGTTYCYVVQAISGTAYSAASNLLQASTPVVTVLAPSAATARLVAGTTANASPTVTVGWTWGPNVAPNVAVTRFDIQRQNNAGVWVTIGTTTAGTRNFTDPAPVLGATNVYQVLAVNVTGGVQTFSNASPSASVVVPTLPLTVALAGTTPTCVVGPAGTLPCRIGFGGRTVTLGWPSLATTGATAVAVQRSTTANNFAPGTVNTTNVALTSTGLVVNGLARNTSYNFRMRFTNAAGFVYDTTFTIVTSP